VSRLLARLRTASWLGWQVESNLADPLIFTIYAVLRPLSTALILAGMYWAVSRFGRPGGSVSTARAVFVAIWIGSAFHTYVTQVLIAMGWVVVEEREEYETLKYVYASPIGIFTYLAGRSTVKLVLATISVALQWGLLAASFVLGIIATVSLGFIVAGVALLLPRVAMTLNEGVAVALYLLCGVIFPIDLLPRGLQEVTLALPFTWWYEALRRAIVGHGISTRLGALPNGVVLGALFLTTAVLAVGSRHAYLALEMRARRLGRLDQTTMF